MKTPFIPKLILLFILFFLYSAGYAQQRDSITIRGQVTDYNGQPIDSCSIFWQSPSFDDIKQAITDKNGYYTTRIPKGKYQSMGAINMSTYPHTVKPGLAEKDQRLEFWAWNFIADRDTTLNIRYHRMEVWTTYFPHPWRHAHLSDICSTHESDPHPAMAKRRKILTCTCTGS